MHRTYPRSRTTHPQYRTSTPHLIPRNSLAFNGSPYEHASCVVIYDMLKIELTPKAEFTENIKNADMNSLAQGTCAMFSELAKIHTVSYTFYDFQKNVINQHTVQKNDCR